MVPAPPRYRPRTGLRILVALAIIGVIVMNAAANIVPFFGRGTGEVSALYPTLVTPAGYVFAIWGVIYLGLIAYSIAQFTGHLAEDPLPDLLAWPLVISSVANVVWLLLWHSLNIYWTVPFMLVLLASLIVSYQIARTGRPSQPTALERWTVRAPLGVYLGWVSVATIANISGALVAAAWGGFGIPAAWWGIIVLLVATALAFANLVRVGDCVFAGVFVWALAGIAVATSSASVQLVAGTFATMVGIGILVSVITRRRLV